MKKSMLLSFVTAGAIIATSVGTYAVWDTTVATSGGNIEIGSPVTLTATTPTNVAFTETRELNSAPSYKSAPMVFTISDKEKVKSMKLEATVKDGDSDVTSQMNATIYKTGDDSIVSTSIPATELTAGESGNSYYVVVAPQDTATDLAGKNLTVCLTATLE